MEFADTRKLHQCQTLHSIINFEMRILENELSHLYQSRMSKENFGICLFVCSTSHLFFGDPFPHQAIDPLYPMKAIPLFVQDSL